MGNPNVIESEHRYKLWIQYELSATHWEAYSYLIRHVKNNRQLKLLRLLSKLIRVILCPIKKKTLINRLTPNDPYMGRTAPLTSRRCILYIYSTNICTEYFKHALYSPFLSLQYAVCFIMLTCSVPVLFTFYIQGVLKLKKNNSDAKGLKVIDR